MGKITIMGKMKDKVKINNKIIEFKDIMNDNNKNFIKDLLEDSKSLIDYKNETICIDRPDFDDESINYIENKFEFNGMKFKLKLSRETYKNKIDDGFLIIICTIEYKAEDNVESMLAAYDLKEKIHKWIFKYCNKIYWMHDDNNLRLSTYMYELIHKNENKFREVLSLYMLKKYGYTFMSKCIVIKGNYTSNRGKYKKKMWRKPKKVKLDFYNIGFRDLPKLLTMEINDVKLVGKQIPKEVSYDFGSNDSKYIFSKELLQQLDDTYFIKKKKSKKYFNPDNLKKLGEREIYFDKNFEDEYGRNIVKFTNSWEQLGDLRNIVMHNKLLTRELIIEILELSKNFDKIFNNCLELIDGQFETEEVYLNDQRLAYIDSL